MSQSLTYTQVEDYYYPDLCLPETDDRPLGKYGMLRKTYLKQHRPMLYDRLLLVGQLDSHLAEIDLRAEEMVIDMVEKMAATSGVDEHLKESDQMAWVGAMNNFRAAAEEVVLREIIYAMP